ISPFWSFSTTTAEFSDQGSGASFFPTFYLSCFRDYIHPYCRVDPVCLYVQDYLLMEIAPVFNFSTKTMSAGAKSNSAKLQK
ncbi:MAG: hypothetical protein WBZ05_17560, partial [Desulfobacterales bacterium]